MAVEVSKIIDALEKLGFRNIAKSDANLILAGVPDYFKGGSDELTQRLKERDCSVVSCGAEFGPSIAGKFIRLTPSRSEHNAEFIRILKGICEEEKIDSVDIRKSRKLNRPQIKTLKQTSDQACSLTKP